MKQIRISKRRYAGIKSFKWGIYCQLRWDNIWYHAKIGVWKQNNMRLDSRRQLEQKKRKESRLPRRHTSHVYRLQFSTWTSQVGANNRPFVIGTMFYWGGVPTQNKKKV